MVEPYQNSDYVPKESYRRSQRPCCDDRDNSNRKTAASPMSYEKANDRGSNSPLRSKSCGKYSQGGRSQGGRSIGDTCNATSGYSRDGSQPINIGVTHHTAPQGRNGSNFRVKSSSLSPPKNHHNQRETTSVGGKGESRQGVAHAKHLSEAQLPVTDFTEVFSWGSDRHGQLGLGQQMSAGKSLHNLPRFCSYNIPIFQISCGEKHAAFITTSNLCYTMGSNSNGQLGINMPYVEAKHSPVLVDSLLNFKLQAVACGKNHTLVLTRLGDTFAWGNNDFGQCGINNNHVTYAPHSVNFDQYYRTNIKSISAGSYHSAFVDEIGRLFMCGKGDQGQLGLGSTGDELTPFYVSRIADKVAEAACGEEHSIVLTMKGEVFAMGSNRKGQLGTGQPSKGCALPTFLEELSFSQMVKVRAGSFSASLSQDGQLYVWGEGTFGQFYTPHRIKSAKALDIADFQVSRSGLAVVLSRSGTVYSWGPNDVGQLGHGDFNPRQTPQRVKHLEGKKVTSIGLGEDFTIALGLTMPQREYERLAKANGILKQRLNSGKPNIRRIKPASHQQKKGAAAVDQVLQESIGPLDQERCPLRNKSFQSTNSTSGVNKHSKGNRVGLSSTSVGMSSKQKSHHSMLNTKSQKSQAMKQHELQKVAMLVKSDRQKFTPLREPSPVTSARLSKFNEGRSIESKSSKSVGGRAHHRHAKQKKEMGFEPMSVQKGFREMKENQKLKNEVAETEHAFSNSKNRNTHLEMKNDENQFRIVQQERELIDLRAANVRLADSEAQIQKELEVMRDRNVQLMSDNENMRRQLRAQEDAILQAQSLKEQTDRMIQDYERAKGDLTFHIQKNDEAIRELEATKSEKRKIEDAMRLVEHELNQHRAATRDAQAADSREIVNLQQKLNDKERDCSSLRAEVSAKHSDVMGATKETNQWKDVCDRLSNDKTELQLKIDDLEFKNRKLIEKLNSQIYDHATQYKEKTMNALLKQSGTSHERGPPGRVDSNPPPVESAFARSPLHPRAMPMPAQPSFIEHAGSNPRRSYSPLRDKRSNSPSRVADALKDSHLQGPKYTPSYGQPLPSNSPPRNVPSTYQPLKSSSQSPLRQKSPPRVPLHASNPMAASNYGQQQPTNNSEFIDESYARMKKSCERIAAVLGITRNTSTSPNQGLDTIHNKSPIKTTAPQVNLGNMNNPVYSNINEIRSHSPEKDGQPSGYKSLREKSPIRKSPTKPALTTQDLNTGEAPTATKFASSMVRQSLMDLKERLGNVRREKEQVEKSLMTYEVTQEYVGQRGTSNYNAGNQ